MLAKAFRVRTTKDGYPDFNRILDQSMTLLSIETAVEAAFLMVKQGLNHDAGCPRLDHPILLDSGKMISVLKELTTTYRWGIEPEGDEFEGWSVIILFYPET